MDVTVTSERAADRIRDELLATLEELERRRERVTRVGAWFRSPGTSLPRVVGTLAAAGVVTGAAWWRLEPGRVRLRARPPPRAATGSPARLAPWLGVVVQRALMAGARGWLQRWTAAQARTAREAG